MHIYNPIHRMKKSLEKWSYTNSYHFNFKHNTRDNLKVFILSAVFQDSVSIDEA